MHTHKREHHRPRDYCGWQKINKRNQCPASVEAFFRIDKILKQLQERVCDPDLDVLVVKDEIETRWRDTDETNFARFDLENLK